MNKKKFLKNRGEVFKEINLNIHEFIMSMNFKNHN